MLERKDDSNKKLGKLYETLKNNPGVASLPKNLLALVSAGVLFEIQPSDETEEQVLDRINKKLTDEMKLAGGLFVQGMIGINREYNASPKPANITDEIILKNKLLDQYNNAFATQKNIISCEMTSGGLSVTLQNKISGQLTRLPVAALKKLEKERKLCISILNIEKQNIKNIMGLIYFKEHLSKLRLKNLHLEDLPNMSGFTRLTNVGLEACAKVGSDRNLSELPFQLLLLPLKELSITHQHEPLEFIPKFISEVATLETLNFQKSRVEGMYLPKELKDCAALKKIDFMECNGNIACPQELNSFLGKKALMGVHVKFYAPEDSTNTTEFTELTEANEKYQEKIKQQFQEFKETPPLYFLGFEKEPKNLLKGTEQTEQAVGLLTSDNSSAFFKPATSTQPSKEPKTAQESLKELEEKLNACVMKVHALTGVVTDPDLKTNKDLQKAIDEHEKVKAQVEAEKAKLGVALKPAQSSSIKPGFG